MVNMHKHVYEGWKVEDFIEELEWQLELLANGNSWKRMPNTRKELESWTASNQPYYHKVIPDVVEYFAQKYGIE